MYTGIVEEIGIVERCSSTELTINAQLVLTDLAVKDSIAVDGICLTVINLDKHCFSVETMPETVRKTGLGYLKPGSQVNLERSLPATGRLGGHIVQGHVETCVQVLEVVDDGIGKMVTIELPEQFRPYVITKGFVALNGASLTVVEARQNTFSIALIPYTREHTNLGLLQPGSWLNLETDILGRYTVQFLQSGSSSSPYLASGLS